MALSRRSFIAGLFVAPAVIKIPGLLMPVRPIRQPTIAQFVELAYGDLLRQWQREIFKAYEDAILYGTGGVELGFNGLARRIEPTELYAIPEAQWKLIHAPS